MMADSKSPILALRLLYIYVGLKRFTGEPASPEGHPICIFSQSLGLFES